jgi:hypothetical protein
MRLARPLHVFLIFALGACGAPSNSADSGGKTKAGSRDAPNTPAEPPVVLPWTLEFQEEAVLVADDVRIEGPPGLRDHIAVVQDLEIQDYVEKTLPEGFLREARLKTGVGGFGIRAQLDNLTIAATKRLRILERPGEVPITIEARGEAVWTNTKTKAERRGDFLTLVGARPR